MSRYTSDSITRDLKLEPGVNLLRKPFSFQNLVELVRQRLDAGDAPPRRCGAGSGKE